MSEPGGARKLLHVFNLAESPLSLYSPAVVWAELRQPAPRPSLASVPPPERTAPN